MKSITIRPTDIHNKLLQKIGCMPRKDYLCNHNKADLFESKFCGAPAICTISHDATNYAHGALYIAHAGVYCRRHTIEALRYLIDYGYKINGTIPADILGDVIGMPSVSKGDIAIIRESI